MCSSSVIVPLPMFVEEDDDDDNWLYNNNNKDLYVFVCTPVHLIEKRKVIKYSRKNEKFPFFSMKKFSIFFFLFIIHIGIDIFIFR